jgi:two-component system, cell cycle response regulator
MRRVLLIDPSDARREVLARRLRAQGYQVEAIAEATLGADLALREPPAAVVADLWMPGISGVQLCRLLRSEPATAEVPVILCSDRDEPRNRFWAGRAGAVAYVIKGRTGELMRALAQAIRPEEEADGFFVQLSGGSIDIRDRLARHLDAALFESVIAAELRALASAGSFERLFDMLAQFMCQVTRYRWMALHSAKSERLAIHHHPTMRDTAEREARAALGLPSTVPIMGMEDEDAVAEAEGPEPLSCPVVFAGAPVARFALALASAFEQEATSLVAIVGRELGGAVKIAALVEESERLATTDVLTGMMNRRAFVAAMRVEVARSARYDYPLTFALLDIDHFKRINDGRGHAMGDRVLAALGKLMLHHVRTSDVCGRWGGEEFVVAFTGVGGGGARVAAERLREAIRDLVVADDAGERIPFTASIGLAHWRASETLEGLTARADRAMYASKASGRDRVTVCPEEDAPVDLARASHAALASASAS